MKVFVAGATGVLGRRLLPRLLAGGHSVRGIARSIPTGPPPAGVELVEADLLNDDLLDLVSGCHAVVHIATAIPRDPHAQAAWGSTAQLRTIGTRRLLDAALACGAQRYLQQSIVMAYRDGGDAWLDETSPLDDSPDRAVICQPVQAMEKMVRESRKRASRLDDPSWRSVRRRRDGRECARRTTEVRRARRCGRRVELHLSGQRERHGSCSGGRARPRPSGFDLQHRRSAASLLRLR